MNETPLTEDMVIEILQDWEPNSYLERAKLSNNRTAPYEVSAELRMLRAGHSGDTIRKMLKVRATKLIKLLNDEMGREQKAHAGGRIIYDSPISGR